MPDIVLEKLNDVHVRVHAERAILQEMHEYFSFFAPKYRFHPKYKNKLWSGKIYLLNLQTQKIYLGLIPRIIAFAEINNYTIELDGLLQITGHVKVDEILLKNLLFKAREYQIRAVEFALSHKRCLLESPTGSGKSFTLYLIARTLQLRTLIIVPTISLVHQLESNFIEYDTEYDGKVHKIVAGVSKQTSKNIVISTYQSLTNQDQTYFNSFDVIIVDEAHSAIAATITSIMEKATKVAYRIGTTGTLTNRDATVNLLVLEGLFGKVLNVASIKELTDQKYLSPLKIEILILKYEKEYIKSLGKMTYQEEVIWMINNDKRNNIIANLAINLKGNTIVLFHRKSHGKDLFNKISGKNSKKDVYFIEGATVGEEREAIRNIVNQGDNKILVASYGTMSVGSDIVNLYNVIFAFSFKGSIRNIQSIGRVLRPVEGKVATLYDIVDDLSTGKRRNYSVQHFQERMKIYNEQEFAFKVHQIEI